MIFPSSNLSTAAQPWGRVVEKSIGNLETLVATERVNNAARDAQAVVNIKRLDESVVGLAGTVASIKTITDNVFVTGTTEINGYNIKAGTIDADAINVGELVGFTIKTAASGTRLELAGTALITYYGSNMSGAVYGNVSPVDGSIAMILSSASGGGSVAVSDDNINIQTGAGMTGASIRLVRSSGITMYPGTGSTVSISSGNLSVGGSIGGTSLSVSSASIPSITSSLSVSGNLSTDGSLTRTILATGASTTCTINGSGQFVRTTSSERYKQDIQPLSVDLSKVLQLEPKKFRLKEEAEVNPEARYYAGFIAEEIDALGLDVFVGYNLLEDGTRQPESVYYAELTAALLSVIKNLNTRIEALEGK